MNAYFDYSIIVFDDSISHPIVLSFDEKELADFVYQIMCNQNKAHYKIFLCKTLSANI